MITSFEAQRIASIISGNLRVTIKEAPNQGWSYNFKERTIFYQAQDLINLTEADVIANFLHEAGHAKYSQDYGTLKWDKSTPAHHRSKLHKLCNAIEDFRIEDLIRIEYRYGSDYLPLENFKTIYGLRMAAQEYRSMAVPIPKYIQYCFGIYSQLADVDVYYGMEPEVAAKVRATLIPAFKARYATSNQQLLTIIEQEMYPHIKEYLDDYEDKEQSMKFKGAIAVERHLKKSMEEPPPVKKKYASYDQMLSMVKPQIPPLLATLNRMLTDNKYSHYEGRHRTGPMLNNRKLYKFRLDDFRLFQRKTDAKLKDYVFSLVVDESGSMRNDDKIGYAVKSAILFSEVLKKLNIPYSISGFNRTFRTYKKPEEDFSLKTKKGFEEMYQQAFTPDAGWNSDGLAIRKFAQPMAQYSGKKVMIVLSDGNPEEWMDGRAFPLAGSVRYVEKMGIETVGIGVLSTAVKEYYPTHIIVRAIEDLPKMMLGQLKGKLKKG